MKWNPKYSFKQGLKAGILPLLLLASLLFPSWAQAGEVEVIKTIQKSFSLDAEEVIKLSNEYGKIHINTWEKPQLSVKVIVKAYGPTEALAQQRLEEARIEMDQSREGVFLITRHKKEVLLGKRGVKVNYEISAPANSPLHITSKFCDVYIGDRTASLDLAHSNGNVVLGRLSHPDNRLQVSFGKTDLAYIKGGMLQFSYGHLLIARAGDIRIQADGTEVQIGQANEIMLNANLCDMKLGEVSEIKGRYSSATFQVEKLAKSLDVEVKYAKLFEIKQVSTKLRGVRIKSYYSTLHLGFANQLSFDFDASVQYGKLLYEARSISMTVIHDESQEQTNYQGRFGPDRNPSARVELHGQYGHIKID
jgi:hypothetical protein